MYKTGLLLSVQTWYFKARLICILLNFVILLKTLSLKNGKYEARDEFYYC